MLSFCLNAFPCGSPQELRTACFIKAGAVRTLYNALAGTPDAPFSLGLWLGQGMAAELSASETVRREFAESLQQAGMFAVTINAFPYDVFHGQTVKQRVYHPDWSTPERLRHTCRCAEVLAALLPAGREGTISTLPIGYAPRRADGSRDYPAPVLNAAIENLLQAADFLRELEQRTGKCVRLALEPEPDCFLDDPESVAEFYPRLLAAAGSSEKNSISSAVPAPVRLTADEVRRYLGICLDTAHCAARFCSPADTLARWHSAGIPVYKMQFACALETDIDSSLALRLQRYNDTVYLHQSAWQTVPGGAAAIAPDLPEALTALQGKNGGVLRAHYHLPLTVAPPAGVRSVGREFTPEFFRSARKAGCEHFEVEIYTIGLLMPPEEVPGVFAADMNYLRQIMDKEN